jgi:hypothetical protein
MNNVQPQCRIVAALITAFLMIPAMSASAQPTQNGPTSDWSSGDNGDKQTLIATAFDEPLYLEQLTPAEAEVKRKELSHTEFEIWLRSVQGARTYDNIWAAVSRRYVEREKLDVKQDEIDAIVKSVEQRMKSEPEQPAGTTPTPAEWKGISVAWARASLLDWKVCKSLYEKYGGRVGMGSLGAWTALDGQYALLREHLKAGDIKFHHAEMENAFWKYAQRVHFADTYPKGDRLKYLLSTPPFSWSDESLATAPHSGTIVSHIDSYGSGTGSRSELSSSGQMVTGFDYGNPAKPDWKGSIKWQLLRREGKSDVYQIEWNFEPMKGTSTSKTEELSFDGVTPSKLVVNTQWVISIEPVQPLAKENRERIGLALGREIYRDQLQDSPPSYTEVVQLFMTPAMEEFERQHWDEIDMTDEEIREAVTWLTEKTQLANGEAWERWQAKTVEVQAKVDQRLREGQRQLDDPARTAEQLPKLKTMLRVIALKRTHPHATEAWLIFHRRKFEQYLFNNYGGGRIIHQQFGPEALDARRKLLLELEKARKFEITDPELRKLAYDYWERPSHPGGFHTDHRILLFPWMKAHQEMIRENEGAMPAKIK